MRAVYHPRLDEITVEGILHALSDPIRAEIFMRLATSECGKNCSTFLQLHEKLAKSTLSQHLRILREAGLIRSERKGVELINATRCGELEQRFGPMIRTIIDSYARQRKGEKEGKPADAPGPHAN